MCAVCGGGKAALQHSKYAHACMCSYSGADMSLHIIVRILACCTTDVQYLLSLHRGNPMCTFET